MRVCTTVHLLCVHARRLEKVLGVDRLEEARAAEAREVLGQPRGELLEPLVDADAEVLRPAVFVRSFVCLFVVCVC